MAVFALASDYNRLTPTQRSTVTHWIADDGTWTEGQITGHINLWSAHRPDPLPDPFPDDWTQPEPLI